MKDATDQLVAMLGEAVLGKRDEPGYAMTMVRLSASWTDTAETRLVAAKNLAKIAEDPQKIPVISETGDSSRTSAQSSGSTRRQSHTVDLSRP